MKKEVKFTVKCLTNYGTEDTLTADKVYELLGIGDHVVVIRDDAGEIEPYDTLYFDDMESEELNSETKNLD